MRSSLHLRRLSSRSRLSWVLLLLLLSGRHGLTAQSQTVTTPAATVRDTATHDSATSATGPPQSFSGSGSAASTDQMDFLGPLTRRDALLGLTAWDHTLVGAFQLGASLLHLSTIVPTALRHTPGRPEIGQVLRSSLSTPRASLDQIAKALRMDQLEHQGMNLNLKSAYGNFRLQYREIFNSNGRTNSLGGGVGQAAAAAMYTSPRFGNSKLLDSQPLR